MSLRVPPFHVRVRADTQASLLPHRRHACLESLRRQQRHFAERVHQRERPNPRTPSPFGRGGTKRIAAEHPGERSRGPRMAHAVLPVRVARDDGEWTGDRCDDHRLLIRVHDDGPARPAIALKALAIQPLARRRPFQLGQALIGSGLIDVLDRGRLNLRHPGVIRIRLRCHVASVRARLFDHLEQLGSLGETDAIDVHHVQRRVGFGGERERFLEPRDARANVHVDWCLGFRGDAEHGEQLSARCRRRVRKPGADVDRALAETNLDALRDLANLRGRRRPVGAVAHRHPGAGIVHHRHPDLDVADRDAVVDAFAALSLAIPGRDVGRAELELECGRHAVKCVEPIGLGRLSVRVQVDEAGGDD